MDVVIYPKGILDVVHPGQGTIDISEAHVTELVLDISLFWKLYKLQSSVSEYETWDQEGNQSTQTVKHLEPLYECLNTVLEKCRDANLKFTVAAAPCLSRDTRHKDLNGILLHLAKESIKICGKAGCNYLVVPPLSAGISSADMWNVNSKFYLQLASCAKESGVMILLENQCRDINGHLVRGICSDGSEAARWVDMLNEEAGELYFGFCMDVGVCNLCGQNMYDFCTALGKRMKAVSIRDCDGIKENSMLPFTCVDKGQRQTDWLNLIRGLRKIEFDGKLMINLTDTVSAFSPILRPGLLKLAKSVADYMKWQIEMEGMLKRHPLKVLFGAGNMCRNYMKCYGEQYPPLFTCDNNKALWGSDFCGLEVKSPECMKSLPPEYTIFICNIYYREIEKQLRDMGITNRIEYFNDEYMPTFYFDRLEGRGKV